MAQTGYTPILVYSSSTAAAAPTAGNLTNSTLGSELAINITDGKLFYKDNANVVQVIAWKTTPTTAGGTGLTSYTAGDLLYYATGTTLTKLAIGATGRWLGSSGTAPQWNAPAALTKTDDTNVTLTLGGSASTALLNAASLTLGWTGTLAVSRGGTGTGTAFTAGSVVFAGASGVYSQDNSNLFWDDVNNRLGIGIAAPAQPLHVVGTSRVSQSGASRYRSDWYVTGGVANWNGYDDTGGVYIPMSYAASAYTWYSGTAGSVRAIDIFASGGVSIGNTTDPGATCLSVTGDGFFGGSTSNSRVNIKAKSGNRALSVQRSNGDNYFYTDNDNAVSTGANAADTVLFMNKITSNNRSINAAGTLNASGADYAEYMTKTGDFVIAKGDVCGVDAEGKLTNVFANAVSFVVKSSDPSFVGGDTWGADLEGDELEAARQKVDRVAFAGQVPVNITGAAPGQYIVPIDDGGAIKPSAVDEANMTLAMYIKAVGKVIAIEPDGRAKIIVKTA